MTARGAGSGTRAASLLLLFVSWAVLVSACSRSDHPAATPKAADTRPNFLFIISDDQSWAHTSRAGYPLVSTPNFDRIANEGLYFPNAFVSAPSCTPSRSAILAGQDFWRLQSAALLWGEYSQVMISYQDILRKAGYAVGFTGKGWGPGYIADRTVKPTGDEYNSIRNNRSENHGPWDLAGNFRRFLERKPADAPFSFWVGSVEPHRPYDDTAPNRFTPDNAAGAIPPFLPNTSSVQTQLSSYLDEIETFDEDVGSVLKVLQEKGQLDNTLIVVTSDNGMEFSRGKPTLYAYGVRVPLAMYWHGVMKPRTVEEFVSLTDIAPTFLAAAGIDVPAAMTGRSLLPLLAAGDAPVDWHSDAAFVGYERHAGFIREGNLAYPSRAIYTADFTYIRNYFPARWPVGDPPRYVESIPWLLQDPDNGSFLEPYFSRVTAKRPAEELYDLRRDPFQLTNVAADPHYADALANLRSRLTGYLVKTGDPAEVSGDDRFSKYPYHGPKS